jgi:hypothetical protein
MCFFQQGHAQDRILIEILEKRNIVKSILTNCINRPLPKSFLTIAQTPIIVLKRKNSRKGDC